MIIIDLTIKKYCIQTQAKKLYEGLITKYFNKKTPIIEKDDILKEIDALKFFLKNCNFGLLRSENPELSGQKEIKACLCFPKDYSKMYIKSLDKKIKPIFNAYT